MTMTGQNMNNMSQSMGGQVNYMNNMGQSMDRQVGYGQNPVGYVNSQADYMNPVYDNVKNNQYT